MIFAGGDEMLQARSQDIPIVYLAEIFTEYPVALIVPADSAIQTPADLKGHSIGIPGEFGETYFGLLALLAGAGLTQDDVIFQVVGFTQVAALLGGPGRRHHRLRQQRTDPALQQRYGHAHLPGSRPAAADLEWPRRTEKTLQDHPDQVKAAIAATLKGVDYTIAHPQEALDISKKYVDGLDDPTNAANAMAVLQATLPLWKQGGQPGKSTPTTGNSMADFLQAQGQLAKPVDRQRPSATSICRE